MFGSLYYQSLDQLFASLFEMNSSYGNTFRGRKRGVLSFLYSTYIRIFGIPEVGFQLRGMHYRKMLRILPFYPRRILDVGSGIGCYVFDLARRFPRAAIDGIEVDTSKIQISKKIRNANHIHNVSIQYGDITAHLETKSEYDLVICIDVLEHIADFNVALQRMYTLLGNGGFLYIHTPSVHQRRHFHSLRNWSHATHMREGFMSKELVKDLKKIGFSIVSLEHTFGPLGSLAWELQHVMLAKSQLFSAVLFPFLYVLSYIDSLFTHSSGLCIAVLAKKES